MENHKAQGDVEEFHLPEWETAARHRGKKQSQTDQKFSVKERGYLVLDRVMPSHTRYFGFSRKVVCIATLLAFLILLALILGLAIGLSKKSRYAFA